MRKNVVLKLPSLEFHYLYGALEGLAKYPCHRSNCGTACLCNSCAVRRVFPLLDKAKENAKRD